MKVPLLDLKAQYYGIKDEIQGAIAEVLESQRFILGPKVEALERAVAAYCGCQYAVGVSSGTDALLIAQMTVGIGPGHGVITTPYTFFATAGSIERLGARPFFVDIDPLTYNIHPMAIQNFVEEECMFEAGAEQLVHRKTGTVIRAVMPVHLYGQCADMDPIVALAKENGLLVIEDAAQAIGAGYPSQEDDSLKPAGSGGDFGCFSFFPTKNLGGFGDGGMVTTDDPEFSDRLKALRAHGSKPKYFHHLVGGNFRLDALQAAVLLVKLKYLEDWTGRRRQNAASYNSLFQQSGLVDAGLIALPRAIWEDGLSVEESSARSEAQISRREKPAACSAHRPSHIFSHIYNQYVVRARYRNELRSYLADQGIGAEIYYPLALHQQKCFEDLGYCEGDFPESEKAVAENLALPIYPELEPAQREYVVENIRLFYESKQ